MKKLLLFTVIAFLMSCHSNIKDRHIFHYVITGTSDNATDLHGVMGPGIKFDMPVVQIPFEVTHEVYGTNLDYELSITSANTANKYSVKVFIDDKLIAESSEYDKSVSPPKISVKGVFVQ